jgi:ABC-type antimicrobial peptide transport system permease subunit
MQSQESITVKSVVLIYSSLFWISRYIKGMWFAKEGAVIILGTTYIIGVPLSVVLGFVVHLRAKVLYHILRLNYLIAEVSGY